MEELVQFMSERNMSEDIINHFISENIDPSSILIMPYEQFEILIKKKGDAIAVYDFCKKQIMPKKQSLIAKLKKRIDEKNSKNPQALETVYPKKRKQTRQVILGWMCAMDGVNYTHVRLLQGGGARHIQIDRNAKTEDVFDKAKKLFFPNDKSPKGDISEFDLKLVDFQGNDLDPNLTIDEYFKLTDLPRLRLYLAAKKKKVKTYQNSLNLIKRRRTAASIASSSREFHYNSSFSNDDDEEEENEMEQICMNREYKHESATNNQNSEVMVITRTQDQYCPLTPECVYAQDVITIPEDGNQEELSTSVLEIGEEYTNLTNPTSNQTTTVISDLEMLVNSILDQTETDLPEVEYVEPQTVNELLTKIQQNIIYESTSQFNIYREDVFECCIRAMKRKTFNAFNKVSVKFSDTEGVSEGAVDIGGPSREMFRLVLNYIMTSQMFCGTEKKNLNLCARSIEQKHYFEAGRLISMSLIHGGPAPHFFSENLFAALISQNCDPSIDDVPNDIKFQLIRFQEATSLKEMQDIMCSTEFFSVAGLVFIKNADEKELIFKSTLKFYAVDRIQEPLKQLRDGLQTCNLYENILKHPQLFKPLFCGDKITVSSDTFENIFRINYSETGSNLRTTENRIISFFRDYLLDCEERSSNSDEDGTVNTTIQDILVFATGADCIPPLGFPEQPKICFLHEQNIQYPMANTCALQLKLPTVHKKYDQFKLDMDFGIGNSKAFGYA